MTFLIISGEIVILPNFKWVLAEKEKVHYQLTTTTFQIKVFRKKITQSFTWSESNDKKSGPLRGWINKPLTQNSKNFVCVVFVSGLAWNILRQLQIDNYFKYFGIIKEIADKKAYMKYVSNFEPTVSINLV